MLCTVFYTAYSIISLTIVYVEIFKSKIVHGLNFHGEGGRGSFVVEGTYKNSDTTEVKIMTAVEATFMEYEKVICICGYHIYHTRAFMKLQLYKTH